MDYRIYALTQGNIKAREDFEADNDADALAVAIQLCEAVADLYDSVELWQGTRRIGGQAACRTNDIAYMEDALLTSRWAVAQSRRLLTRLSEGRTRRSN